MKPELNLHCSIEDRTWLMALIQYQVFLRTKVNVLHLSEIGLMYSKTANVTCFFSSAPNLIFWIAFVRLSNILASFCWQLFGMMSICCAPWPKFNRSDMQKQEARHFFFCTEICFMICIPQYFVSLLNNIQ